MEIHGTASRPGQENLPCILLHVFPLLPDDDKARGDGRGTDERNLGS